MSRLQKAVEVKTDRSGVPMDKLINKRQELEDFNVKLFDLLKVEYTKIFPGKILQFPKEDKATQVHLNEIKR